MPTRPSTVDFILEQMASAGPVSSRKMFGEYGVFREGKMVALVCDDQLFVKPTAGGRAYLGAVTEAPPYKGAKPCFAMSGESWDDGERLAELIRIMAAELPEPKRRTPRRA